MRLGLCQEIRLADEKTRELLKLPPGTLMEAAGVLSAQHIHTDFFSEIRSQKKIVIVCGPGNNGGDGLAVARHLHGLGVLNLCIGIVKKDKRSDLCQNQLERVEQLGLPVVDLSEDKSVFDDCGLIVDAIFGTGLSKAVSEPYFSVIEAINAKSQVPVVSLDVPSGLNSDTGLIQGTAVRAHTTLSFGVAKPGFYTDEGPRCAGKIKVVSIGHPRSVIKECCRSHFLFTARLARRHLPPRTELTNKSTFGRLLVLAGHPGMWGALRLTVEAAYRMGVGYVTVKPAHDKDALGDWTKELGCETLLTQQGLNQVKADALVLGPGLGDSAEAKKLFFEALDSGITKGVIDADGLNLLAKDPRKLKPSFILTPHSAELGRLLGVSAEEVNQKRFDMVRKASEKFGCSVLLKGFRTLVCNPEGQVAIVHAGNQSLAKAGTGDVLSGFIGSLLAQGVENPWAGLTGAFIHGMIADHWVRDFDSRTMMASDLNVRLAMALKMLAGY